MQSQALVSTTKGSIYLKQMCRHFAHKITVEFDDLHGHATFAMGICTMDATADRLTLNATAGDQAALEKVQEIVGSHLERFAFREAIKVVWQPSEQQSEAHQQASVAVSDEALAQT